MEVKTLNKYINKDNDTMEKINNQQQLQTSSDNEISETISTNYESQLDNKKQDNTITNKSFKIFGGICIAIFIGVSIFINGSSVDKSKEAKEALKNKVSTSLSAGAILLKEDEIIEAKDYTITNTSENGETKFWIWDYAAEDGDYVQIYKNGAPIGDAFMIRHKPVSFSAPSEGEIQVKGIKDGGGGITYAVKFDVNGTCYFNYAPEGKFNTYTIIVP